jgi:hypothetical protein
MTAQEIELCVAQYFNYRQNLIVPNVWWGWGLNYEADLVVLRKSGWATEVEIKTTASDIKADLLKRHNHDSPRFFNLWFAVPEALQDNPDIPPQAGILSISHDRGWHVCRSYRPAKRNPGAQKITPDQRLKLTELGVLRTWGLKAKLAVLQHRLPAGIRKVRTRKTRKP